MQRAKKARAGQRMPGLPLNSMRKTPVVKTAAAMSFFQDGFGAVGKGENYEVEQDAWGEQQAVFEHYGPEPEEGD